MSIKIAIAAQAFLVREGFKKIIEDKKHIKLIAEISEEKDLWIKLENTKPDILILDYNDDGIIKLEDISKISAAYPSLQIIAISNNERKENILYLINSGVKSYLTKECDEEEIFKAIEMVSNDKKFFCERILDIILEKPSQDDSCKGICLSSRETEVIKLIVEGSANKEIADKLFISIHTVYTHRKNIVKKLGLKSPVEIALYAINNGLT